MTLFQRRAIERTKTLGERLRKIREEAGLTISDVAQGTGIRAAYLEAVEQGNYAAMPGSVYIENYLKRYAEFLKVDPAYVLDLYRQREQRVLAATERSRFVPKPQELPREIISPRLIRRLLIGAVVCGALAYLGITVVNVFSPPPLVVTNPSNNSTVSEPTIVVSGTTQPETVVTINGREVFLDSAGTFSETVTLTEGINVISVSSKKKRSKPVEVVRTVLLELEPEQ